MPPFMQGNNLEGHLLCDRQPYLLEVLARTTDKGKIANAVLNGTGPWLLRDAFAAWSKDAGPLAKGYAGPASPDGRRMYTHPFGKWFVSSFQPFA